MIGAGGRAVRLSARADRALWAGYLPIEIARNPVMVARRKARNSRAHCGYKLPNQRRAYQALNCFGVRIWANKPRPFKGMKWRAACATVARFVARCEFREAMAWRREGLAVFSDRRRLHALGVDGLSVTGDGFSWVCGIGSALDAPDLMAAGGMYRFDPWPFDYESGSPLYAARGRGE